MIGVIVLTILGVTSILLFAFGVNLLYLTLRATRLQRRRGHLPVVDEEPLVCVQVPIYNERYVAERRVIVDRGGARDIEPRVPQVSHRRRIGRFGHDVYERAVRQPAKENPCNVEGWKRG